MCLPASAAIVDMGPSVHEAIASRSYFSMTFRMPSSHAAFLVTLRASSTVSGDAVFSCDAINHSWPVYCEKTVHTLTGR